MSNLANFSGYEPNAATTSKKAIESLNGRNYPIWAVEMEAHLQKEKLWDHVSGDADEILKDPNSGLTKYERYQFKQGE
jgi:hypothetical protein